MLRLQRKNSPERQQLPAFVVDDATPGGMTIAREFSQARLELVRLLRGAAEIEHALMLQYLYGALSLKPRHADVAGTPDGRRSDCLLGIAVQEMHHFGDVNRLVLRFGGRPNMDRSAFPYEPEIYPFALELERLTRASIAKYIYVEAPAGFLDEIGPGNVEDQELARLVKAELPQMASGNHIGTLYASVLELLDTLLPDETPPDLAQIRETILRIKNDGEVAHFEFFKALFFARIGSLALVDQPWRDPADDEYPSFPVAANPSALLGHPRQIQDSALLALARLGNLHYWIILACLGLSFDGEAHRSLLAVAVRHMMEGLFPLSLEIAKAYAGMPFDSPPAGYAGPEIDQLALLRLLLAEASQQVERLFPQHAELKPNQAALIASSRQAIESEDGANDEVVIIGSGPAGIAAASALASRSIPVRLLERASVVAGKAHSYHEGQRSIEHGVHGWWRNYLNFDGLLRQAGVDPAAVLKDADGSNLAFGDGRIERLRNYTFGVPSPLFLVLQMLQAPYFKLSDVFGIIPFAIHLLAFRHERDYAHYDGFSMQDLMDRTRVPDRVRRFLLTPFILSFDFALPCQVSAACALSGLQFYLLHDQNSIVARWSRGLPGDKIFRPLLTFFGVRGGRLETGAQVQGIVVKDNRVAGVRYHCECRGGLAEAWK